MTGSPGTHGATLPMRSVGRPRRRLTPDMPLSPALRMGGKRRFPAVLLAVACGALAVTAAGSGKQVPFAPECVRSPTAECVLAAAIETAKAIDDATERADALLSIAEAQKTVGDERGRQETLAHARAAHAEVEVPSTLPARPDIPSGDDLFEPGTIEDDLAKAETIVDIAEAQISAGALQDAARTMRRARAIFDGLNDTVGLGILSDALQRLAGLQARAGDFGGALVTAELMGDGTSLQRAIALSDIAHAQAAAGDPAGAFVIEQRVEDAYFRMIVVTEVGLALAASEDVAGAAAAAARITEIEEQEIWDPVYTEAEIMRSLIFQGIVEAHIADGALDMATGALEKIERGYQYVDAAIAVARAQMAGGKLDNARMTAGWICRTRHRNDRCVEALADLALAHAEAGDIRKARELVSLARESFDRPMIALELFRAYASLSVAQTKMGNAEGGHQAFAKALTAANDMDYLPEDRVDNLAALGEALAVRTGQLDSAERAFSAAMAAASDNGDFRPELMGDIRRRRADAFLGAGEARAQAGDVSGAREALSLALAGVQAVDDEPWRAHLLRDIALALSSVRDGALSGDSNR